ncbi:uncharacterized protein N7506_001829 [Penicillium brevicompactum]|uniref:uncharacterized protein n=1 Tax=Penicillium brevicompactum TaxID=5074 RepID=UPI002541C470|nr:uncharacterized protein N7506_001829 [Penicillium brevicompactum]KAJ5348576.1 hypothetical protein N7506_001829 [Penicillium brevicompactum]
MTPPDKSSTESRMHTLFADFQKSIETSDRARVSAEPRVPSQKIPRSILKNRERTSPRQDRPEDRPRKRVRFEPASGGPLKESVLSGAHTPEKSIASWSLRGKVKLHERQSRRNGGKSPQSMGNKEDIEALGTEVKSFKRELETMRSCRSDARSSEQDR